MQLYRDFFDIVDNMGAGNNKSFGVHYKPGAVTGKRKWLCLFFGVLSDLVVDVAKILDRIIFETFIRNAALVGDFRIFNGDD